METIPVVSIITPVYNGEKYIVETIESVLQAKITVPYEYLVLNDGSADSTLKILQHYQSKIRIFSHENIGESRTVNRGLEMARGKYILVLSADDPMLSGDLVNKAVINLEANNCLVALYPDWKIIDESGNTLKVNILPEYTDEIMIGHSRCLPGPGVVFRKDAAIKIGGRRAKWKYVGDYDFWLRLSREGKIERMPGVLAQWRNNLASTSISQRGLNMASERIKVIENFLSEHSVSDKLNRKARGNSYCIAARLSFFDPLIPGRKLLIQAFKFRRGWPEEAKFHIVMFLLLLPISYRLVHYFSGLKNTIITR